MTVATFWVDGIPKAQPRPRAFRRGNRAAVFDPGTAEGWKGLVAAASRDQRPAAPLDQPLEVELRFFLPRAKARMRKADPAGEIPCTSKPDADNLAKAVLDAMTQEGWWRDDAQVVRLIVEKWWHAKDGRPGMAATVRGV